jgi:hypothetical protein
MKYDQTLKNQFIEALNLAFPLDPLGPNATCGRRRDHYRTGYRLIGCRAADRHHIPILLDHPAVHTYGCAHPGQALLATRRVAIALGTHASPRMGTAGRLQNFDPAKATKAMRKGLPDWRNEVW